MGMVGGPVRCECIDCGESFRGYKSRGQTPKRCNDCIDALKESEKQAEKRGNGDGH